MKTILIVDDQASVRGSLQLLLSKMPGIEAKAFGDGREALSFMADNPQADIALILTDVRMPDYSGIDFARDVRLRGLTTPIAFMSGTFDLQTVAEVSQISRILLAKPFDSDILREIVSIAVQ